MNVPRVHCNNGSAGQGFRDKAGDEPGTTIPTARFRSATIHQESQVMNNHVKAKILDIELALTDPAKVFGDPNEVLGCDLLSHDQKVDVLRRWEMDTRLLSIAEEEGMTGGESNKLNSVGEALLKLGEDKGHRADSGPPSKMGS